MARKPKEDPQKRLQDIVEQLGQSDSEDIERLKQRILQLNEGVNSTNCASVGLYLLGKDNASRYADYPVNGVWAHHGSLAFFLQKDEQVTLTKLVGVNDEHELRVKRGYVSSPHEPEYWKVNFDGARVYRPGELGVNIRTQEGEIITDPLREFQDDNILWINITRILDKETMVAWIVYRVRFDGVLELGEFHWQTLGKNQGRYFGIDKFVAGPRTKVTLTELTQENVRNYLRIFQNRIILMGVQR